MKTAERVLYHQIHPLKLATDISCSLVSLYFFWRHRLLVGLLTHLLPAIIVSALLTAYADLERLKSSRFGVYVGRMMTRTVEAVRLLGDIITVFGAWFHSWPVIAAGFLLVVAAWLSGLRRAPRSA